MLSPATIFSVSIWFAFAFMLSTVPHFIVSIWFVFAFITIFLLLLQSFLLKVVSSFFQTAIFFLLKFLAIKYVLLLIDVFSIAGLDIRDFCDISTMLSTATICPISISFVFPIKISSATIFVVSVYFGFVIILSTFIILTTSTFLVFSTMLSPATNLTASIYFVFSIILLLLQSFSFLLRIPVI